MNATELREQIRDGLGMALQHIRICAPDPTVDRAIEDALTALRACADREERAQAGITPVVVGAALEARSKHLAEARRYSGMADDLDKYEAMRLALQSAALALQGGRDAERWRHLRDGDCDMGDHHLVLARMYTGNNGEPELRCEVADYDEAIDAARAADLSRAIGDSNER